MSTRRERDSIIIVINPIGNIDIIVIFMLSMDLIYQDIGSLDIYHAYFMIT